MFKELCFSFFVIREFFLDKIVLPNGKYSVFYEETFPFGFFEKYYILEYETLNSNNKH